MTRLLLLPLLLLFAACGSDSYDAEDDAYAGDPYADGAYSDGSYPDASYGDDSYQPVRADAAPMSSPSAGGQRVTIMDRGLGMPRGTQVVPQGWTLTQNLATDPSTGQPVSQVLDIQGPRGEFVRSLGLAPYGPMGGADFEQTWRQLAMRGVQLGDASFGQMQRSPSTEALNSYRRAVELGGRKGFRVEALEAPVRGTSGGQAVQGFVYVMRITSPQMPGGVLQASVVLSPADLLSQTLQTFAQMANSYQPNPQYEQRMEQINQAVMQRQTAQHQQRMSQRQASFNAHQQRMASNQAAFNAHQQSMRDLSAVNDQQFQSWQNQQRSGDEMHRRTINGINGTVDLYDSNTGQSYYGAESGYDSYWTDQGGNVVGAQGYDNPDPMQYNQATDYDALYNQGGYDDGW